MELEKKKYPELPVLVVDDSKDFLNTIEYLLLSNGITNVECCQDSKKVMSRLKTRTYSVILLDMIMPGINGMELLSMILNEYPGYPVIMLTGHPDRITYHKCTGLGAGYITKDTDTNELIAAIKKALPSKYDHRLEKKNNLREIDEVEFKTTIYFHLMPPQVFSSKEEEQEEEKKFLRSFFKCGSLTIGIEKIGTNKKKIELSRNEKLIFCYLAYKNYKALKKSGFPDWKSIPDSYEFRVSADPDKNEGQKPEWNTFIDCITEIGKSKPIAQDIRQWKYLLDGILKEKGIIDIIHTQKGRGKGYLLKGRVEFLPKK
jgi:DNA-binding response OmpR family regulator